MERQLRSWIFFFNIVLGETPIEAFKQENHVVPVLGRVALPGD